MRFWQENRNIIIFAGVAIVLLAALRPWPLVPWPISDAHTPVLTVPFKDDAISYQKAIERQNSELKKYFPESELEPERASATYELYRLVMEVAGVPVKPRKVSTIQTALPKGTQTLTDAQAALNNLERQLFKDFNDLRSMMAHVTYPPYRVPKGHEEPGHYYRQQKHKDYRDLEKIREGLENANDLDFNPTLGYRSDVPPTPLQTPFLLIQLGITRDFIDLALHTSLSVPGISLGKDREDKGSPDSLFFEEYPITFDVLGKLPDLRRLIHALPGVHGELVIDEREGRYYMNRGTKHGLQKWERLVVTRDEKFVGCATIRRLEDLRAELQFEEVLDGNEYLKPEAGDRVWNRFYALREIQITPLQNDPLKRLEMSIQVAAIRFKSDAKSTGPARGGVRPGGTVPGVIGPTKEPSATQGNPDSKYRKKQSYNY